MMKKSIDAYMKLRYLTIIVPDECTDGVSCYRAEHPQLAGCMSHGTSKEEAIMNLTEAKRLYIETLLDKGLDVPMPVQPTGGTFSISESIVIVHREKPVKPAVELPEEYDMMQQATEAA